MAVLMQAELEPPLWVAADTLLGSVDAENIRQYTIVPLFPLAN